MASSLSTALASSSHRLSHARSKAQPCELGAPSKVVLLIFTRCSIVSFTTKSGRAISSHLAAFKDRPIIIIIAELFFGYFILVLKTCGRKVLSPPLQPKICRSERPCGNRTLPGGCSQGYFPWKISSTGYEHLSGKNVLMTSI